MTERRERASLLSCRDPNHFRFTSKPSFTGQRYAKIAIFGRAIDHMRWLAAAIFALSIVPAQADVICEPRPGSAVYCQPDTCELAVARMTSSAFDAARWANAKADADRLCTREACAKAEAAWYNLMQGIIDPSVSVAAHKEISERHTLWQKNCENWRKLATETNTTSSSARESANRIKPKLLTLEGTCKLQLFAGWIPCDQRVVFTVVGNGRSFFTFFGPDNSAFSLSGGRDRQPNSENYYLTIDTLRIKKGAQDDTDAKVEGECHLRLNQDASQFYELKCDARSRAAGLAFTFVLEDVKRHNASD
jgi:hypothetical protein